MPDIVVVDDLHERYRPGAPEAVAGISFTVREGEIFGLLGPNGASKSQLLPGVLGLTLVLTALQNAGSRS